jgi:hypothetical protein
MFRLRAWELGRIAESRRFAQPDRGSVASHSLKPVAGLEVEVPGLAGKILKKKILRFSGTAALGCVESYTVSGFALTLASRSTRFAKTTAALACAIDLPAMGQEGLLARDAGSPQFGELRPLANTLEQRIAFYGGVRTIVSLDGSLQLFESLVWFSAIAQY